jgi:uncharacterized protein YecE (DUF72 family)
VPVLVGTSGWQYRDWRGVLYPPDRPQRLWLEHYAGQYQTVENNGTFYRLPARETFADWQARTPDDFVMGIKASRYLTHIKRLGDAAEPVQRMLAAAAGLGSRLGPVLLQLPPTLKADPARLAACLDEIAKFRDGIRVAVEPRHTSWWTDEIRDILAAHDAALCWADRLGHPLTPLWRPAGWGYLRFHEGAAQPWPRYGASALRSWVKRIAQAWPASADVYVYFNNDPGGAAVLDSAAFAGAAAGDGLTVTRTPRPLSTG